MAPTIPDKLIRMPKALPDLQWKALWEHGGFPEPLAQRSPAFSRRWRDSRQGQLLREDIRDLTLVREVAQIGLLVEIMNTRSCDQIVMKSLADELHIAPDTVKHWLACWWLFMSVS